MSQRTHKPQIFGYARVSTADQNCARQLAAFREIHIPESNIFLDVRSGRDFDRPQYEKLLHRLNKGDLLYIKSIDRLGRNYDEVLEQWRKLTKENGVDISVLDMPVLDTRRDEEGILWTFLSDFTLHILSFVSQVERENIRQRQAEGIAAAKARGVRFGPEPKPLPENFHGVWLRWKNGEISGNAAGKECGMSPATFLRRARLYSP